MAKVSMVERDAKRRKLVAKYADKRAALKATIKDMKKPAGERFQAMLALADLPRNGSKTRVRNRCGLTGRPRAYYRKFGISRIAIRELAQLGQLPGVTKSSW